MRTIIVIAALATFIALGPAPAPDDSAARLPLASGPAQCIPPPSDMISWWPAEGTADDVIGPNSGAMVNGATFAPGLVGSAFSFAGNDEYVQTPSPVLTSAPWTGCGWVKPNSVTPDNTQRYLFANGGESSQSHGFFINLNSFSFPNTRWTYGVNDTHGIGSRSLGALPQVPATSTEWTFLCGAWDGSTAPSSIRLYVDGLLADSRTPDTNNPTTGPGRNLRIGAHTFSLGAIVPAWDGLIDEVMIFKRALSDSEIFALYAAGTSGVCPSSSAPVAVAGIDRTVECTGLNGSPVTLNGLLSSDPDDDPLAFTWTGPFPEGGGTVTGGIATVTLPEGTHVITLTVMDTLGLMSTDEVVLTVADTTAPSVTAALQPIAKADDDFSDDDDGSGKSDDDSSGDKDHHFQVVAQAVDACDGSPTVVADINGHAVQDGQRVVIKLSGGKDRVRVDHGLLEFHTRRAVLTVIATDSAGNSSTEQVVLEKSKADDDDSSDD